MVFRFCLLFHVLGIQMDSLTSYQSTIEDIFQGQDAIITNDAYVDDTQDLMLQAEALFEDQSPLIEQMLSMQQQIGDGSAESQMIMFIDDNVPDYAVLQSPMSDTKILNNNDHQRPKIEQMATDEPEWLAQSEFFIGALIVFLSFPLLLNTESRKFKNYMIVQDVYDLRDKGHLVYIQGPTKTLEEYLYDPLTGINARNVLKLYRKVEQLITNHYGDRKWIEREYDIQWFDSVGNKAEQSIFKSQVYYNKCMISNYVMNQDQIEKLDNWTKISINQLYVPDFQVENNNIYINAGDTQLRIQYFVVHSQLLSIVCKSYGNELCPLDIHIPIIDTTCVDDTAQTSTRQDIINYKGCQEELCVKVCQWINWNEWSQDNQHIDYVEEGLLSLEEMFQKRLTYNNTKVGLIRLTSFCLMVVGIWMFFLPIYQVLYLFPIFGQLEIGPMIGMVVGVIFAAVFCLITIGVSYWNKKFLQKIYWNIFDIIGCINLSCVDSMFSYGFLNISGILKIIIFNLMQNMNHLVQAGMTYEIFKDLNTIEDTQTSFDEMMISYTDITDHNDFQQIQIAFIYNDSIDANGFYLFDYSQRTDDIFQGIQVQEQFSDTDNENLNYQKGFDEAKMLDIQDLDDNQEI